MAALLIRLFVRDADKVEKPQVRFRYGKLAGYVGLSANLLLFCLKIAAGVLSGSMAVTADAFNNLSDAGSSVVTLVGFKLSSRPADSQHPFGHGRMEYLSALAVAALIMAAEPGAVRFIHRQNTASIGYGDHLAHPGNPDGIHCCQAVDDPVLSKSRPLD